MNKLLREVPTVESFVAGTSGGSGSAFVPVAVDKAFIAKELVQLHDHLNVWLQEPIQFADTTSIAQREHSVRHWVCTTLGCSPPGP